MFLEYNDMTAVLMRMCRTVEPGPTSDIEVQALDIKLPTLGQDTQGPSCGVMLKITKIIFSMLIMVYKIIINSVKDVITTLWIIN